MQLKNRMNIQNVGIFSIIIHNSLNTRPFMWTRSSSTMNVGNQGKCPPASQMSLNTREHVQVKSLINT